MERYFNPDCLTSRRLLLVALLIYLTFGLIRRLQAQKGPRIYFVVEETGERIEAFQLLGKTREHFPRRSSRSASSAASAAGGAGRSAGRSAGRAADSLDALGGSRAGRSAGGFEAGPISAPAIGGRRSGGGSGPSTGRTRTDSGGGDVGTGRTRTDSGGGDVGTGRTRTDSGGGDVSTGRNRSGGEAGAPETGRVRQKPDGNIELSVDQKSVKNVKALQKASKSARFTEALKKGGKWAKKNPKLATAILAVGGIGAYIVILMLTKGLSFEEALNETAQGLGETAGSLVRTAGEVGATALGGAFEGIFGEGIGDFFGGVFGEIMDPWGYAVLGILFCVCCGGCLLKLKAVL